MIAKTKKPRKKETRKRNRFKLAGHLSLVDIIKSGKLYWVKTSPPIRRYLDIYSSILQPVRFGKKKSGRGVYVSRKNLERFIRLHENNELKKYRASNQDRHISKAVIEAPKEFFFDEEKYLNILDIYKSKELSWIKTYDGVRKYINNTRYKHILQPFRFGKYRYPKHRPPKRGTCVSERNLKKFVAMFRNGEL